METNYNVTLCITAFNLKNFFHSKAHASNPLSVLPIVVQSPMHDKSLSASGQRGDITARKPPRFRQRQMRILLDEQGKPCPGFSIWPCLALRLQLPLAYSIAEANCRDNIVQ